MNIAHLAPPKKRGICSYVLGQLDGKVADRRSGSCLCRAIYGYERAVGGHWMRIGGAYLTTGRSEIRVV
jgi:hypothetical protein